MHNRSVIQQRYLQCSEAPFGEKQPFVFIACLTVAATRRIGFDCFCVDFFFTLYVKMVESSDYSSILERVLFSKHTLPRELRSTASSISRMHSSLFNTSSTTTQHHQSMSHRLQYQQSPRRTPPDLSASSSTSSLLDLLRMSDMIDFPSNDLQQTAPLTPPNLEADKLQRNSLYLTFNAPQVDEYVSLPRIPFHDWINSAPSPLSAASQQDGPNRQSKLYFVFRTNIPPAPRTLPHLPP